MRLAALILFFALAGCASVDTHQNLQQDTATERTASISGVVFRVDKTQDIENAFGGADIFGRKTFAGYTEMRFMGLNDRGDPILRVIDVDATTTETTMSRTGVGFSNTHGRVTGGPGMATFQSNTVYSQPPDGDTTVLPPNVSQFALNLDQTRELRIGNVTITVLDAGPYNIRYRLDDAGG